MFVLIPAPGQAQQPSRELQVLQDTVRDRYRAGAYAEALRFAEEALPLVMREFGAEHEQVSVHSHTLGLVSAAAGDFTKAERYYTQSLRVSEKVYGQDSSGVAVALENLGGVYVKTGRHDAAEPLFQRALRIRQAMLGPNNAYAATGHSNLGDVALARGNWSAALGSYRQAISLLSAQDTSRSILKSIVEDDIKRHRDTFTNLCHAAWQTRATSGASRALVEETFKAAQLAWHTSAASALSKMTARLGAADTDLGRRIRQVQDASDRVLFLHGEDQKILAEWHAVQKADPTYSALLDEFRALSLARSRDNAPATRRQTELAQQLTGLLERCPPGQKKAGCETSERDRAALGKEIGELSKATAAGAEQVRAVHARMEAAEKALPGYQDFSLRRTTLRNDLDVTRLPGAGRAEAIVGRRDAGAPAWGRGACCHSGGVGEELRVGHFARTRRLGADRCRRLGTCRAGGDVAQWPRSAGPARCRRLVGKPGWHRARVRRGTVACPLPADPGAGCGNAGG
jgi:Tfp pilus assembly protein PilF